ncbi:MAG: response regulator [Candidatus Zixiibacteriota bacterium]
MKQDWNILIVEPSRYHARLMERELLEKFPSSSISTFSSASTALEELRQNSYDVAVISLELPDVDCAVLVALIRKEHRNLPIIVTGYGNNTEAWAVHESKNLTASGYWGHPAAEAARAGADEYVVKDSTYHQAIPRLLCDIYRRYAKIEEKVQPSVRHPQKDQAELIRITAGTLYHEINNPLMTILGMCELILNNGCERHQDVIKKVKTIKKSAQRIQSALVRLSSISKPTVKETACGSLIDPQKSRVRRSQTIETVSPFE